MKKPFSVEANCAKCATANWVPPSPPLQWFSKSSFVAEWIIQSSPELSTIPYFALLFLPSNSNSVASSSGVSYPIWSRNSSWQVIAFHPCLAMPCLMSRLDKPFQCWEPMSQLELKLLPVLLPTAARTKCTEVAVDANPLWSKNGRPSLGFFGHCSESRPRRRCIFLEIWQIHRISHLEGSECWLARTHPRKCIISYQASFADEGSCEGIFKGNVIHKKCRTCIFNMFYTLW